MARVERARQSALRHVEQCSGFVERVTAGEDACEVQSREHRRRVVVPQDCGVRAQTLAMRGLRFNELAPAMQDHAEVVQRGERIQVPGAARLGQHPDAVPHQGFRFLVLARAAQ